MVVLLVMIRTQTKMEWLSPKSTPSRFKPKTRKVASFWHSNIIRPTQFVRHIFHYAFKQRSLGCNLEASQLKNCCLIALFINAISNIDNRSPSPSLGNSRFACWPQHICTHRMNAIRVMYVCFLLKNVRKEIQFGL